jgi:hypothetical protein
MAKMEADVVRKIDVVMPVMPLVVKMKCLVISFFLCAYYVGQPS